MEADQSTTPEPTRVQLVVKARESLKRIEIETAPYVKKLEDAKVDLKCALALYDVGERVRVEETCRRGCCLEFSEEGTVVERTKGQYRYEYKVQFNNGSVRPFTDTDMKRVGADPAEEPRTPPVVDDDWW